MKLIVSDFEILDAKDLVLLVFQNQVQKWYFKICIMVGMNFSVYNQFY